VSGSERNSLARSLKRLPAIAALETLWARREADGESEESYGEFLAWLDLGSNRGSPRPAQAADATRYEWAERALAYERAAELQNAENAGNPLTPQQQISNNLVLMLQIETAKLVQQSAKDPGAVVTLKDIVATMNMIAGIQKLAVQAESAKADLSKLSTEELKKVLEAQKILKQLAGGGS
jgi:hypothetical protein